MLSGSGRRRDHHLENCAGSIHVRSLIASGAALIASMISSVPVHAAVDCTVVDLMPAFWQALADKDATTRMRTVVIDRHPDL